MRVAHVDTTRKPYKGCKGFLNQKNRALKLCFFTVFLICGFFSCATKHNESEILTIDTIRIESSYYRREKLIRFDFETVIQKVKGDTTIFSYYDSSGKDFTNDLILIKIDQQKFKVHNQKDSDWVYVKDYVLFDSLQVAKYEIENPAMDGDRGYLISPKYGRLGSYSWESQIFLKKWGDIIFQDTLHSMLRTDSLAFPYIFFPEEETKPK